MSKLTYHNDEGLKEKILNYLNNYSDFINTECPNCEITFSLREFDLAIPKSVITIYETMSNGIPDDEQEDFRINFLKAVPVGVDITNVFSEINIIKLKSYYYDVSLDVRMLIGGVVDALLLESKESKFPPAKWGLLHDQAVCFLMSNKPKKERDVFIALLLKQLCKNYMQGIYKYLFETSDEMTAIFFKLLNK